nr:PhnD/SsuA/transferrin family substrate-binding protein [Prosthecomicrobium pneumaticum]
MGPETSGPETTGSTPADPVVPPADWRAALPVLRVGLLAGANPAYRQAQAEPFRSALARALGIDVQLVPAKDTGALVAATASGAVDYAVLSAAAYVAADARCACVEPLVQPTTADGSTGFRSMIVGRRDGPHLLSEAAGRTIAVGPETSLAGRLVPFGALGAAGTAPEEFFGRIVAREDDEAPVLDLLSGRADLATVWTTAPSGFGTAPGSGPVADLAAEGLVAPDDLVVLFEAPGVPFGPHVVRRDLPEEAKRTLSSTLTGMAAWQPEAYDAIERRFAGGFVRADAARYTDLSALLSAR